MGFIVCTSGSSEVVGISQDVEHGLHYQLTKLCMSIRKFVGQSTMFALCMCPQSKTLHEQCNAGSGHTVKTNT